MQYKMYGLSKTSVMMYMWIFHTHGFKMSTNILLKDLHVVVCLQSDSAVGKNTVQNLEVDTKCIVLSSAVMNSYDTLVQLM